MVTNILKLSAFLYFPLSVLLFCPKAVFIEECQQSRWLQRSCSFLYFRKSFSLSLVYQQVDSQDRISQLLREHRPHQPRTVCSRATKPDKMSRSATDVEFLTSRSTSISVTLRRPAANHANALEIIWRSSRDCGLLEKPALTEVAST